MTEQFNLLITSIYNALKLNHEENKWTEDERHQRILERYGEN